MPRARLSTPEKRHRAAERKARWRSQVAALPTNSQPGASPNTQTYPFIYTPLPTQPLGGINLQEDNLVENPTRVET